MSYTHQTLADGRWFKLTLIEQLANIGADVGRAINWGKKGNRELSTAAFYRALELLSLSIDDPQNRSRLKELTRLYEVLVDYFAGDNIYGSSDLLWDHYFTPFNYVARAFRI